MKTFRIVVISFMLIFSHKSEMLRKRVLPVEHLSGLSREAYTIFPLWLLRLRILLSHFYVTVTIMQIRSPLLFLLLTFCNSICARKWSFFLHCGLPNGKPRSRGWLVFMRIYQANSMRIFCAICLCFPSANKAVSIDLITLSAFAYYDH